MPCRLGQGSVTGGPTAPGPLASNARLPSVAGQAGRILFMIWISERDHGGGRARERGASARGQSGSHAGRPDRPADGVPATATQPATAAVYPGRDGAVLRPGPAGRHIPACERRPHAGTQASAAVTPSMGAAACAAYFTHPSRFYTMYDMIGMWQTHFRHYRASRFSASSIIFLAHSVRRSWLIRAQM